MRSREWFATDEFPGYDENGSASRSFLARSTRRPVSCFVPSLAPDRVFPLGVAKRTTNMRRRCHALTFLAAILAWPLFAQADPIEIRPGDHLSIIGNTLADRMQHDGWLETLLQARFPAYKLVIRNLGFSGDELKVRLRSANFGTPDEWLSRTKTDVVFAFFGYNESFAGGEGLAAFRSDLDAFIKHTLAQKYNGQSAPRLVVFSPIAVEAPLSRDLPEPSASNERLKLYTVAMGEVARANHVAFVDLFTPTAAMFAREQRSSRPNRFTINGVHLDDYGNRVLARLIMTPLFPGEPVQDGPNLESIRQAVLEKNFTWFNRYRTVDGYSIFGGRADLSFTDGQTNRVVAQREMEVLDVMTANRDRRIWAAAQGRTWPARRSMIRTRRRLCP